MVNALQGMAYVQQQGELGRQRGMENRLAGLASQAYTATPEQQQGLLASMAQTSPEAARAQQQQFQADESRTMQQLRGFVNYVNTARKSGNPAAVDAALRAGGPMIQRLTGKPAPTTWTPEMDAGWAELEAKVAMAPAGANGMTIQSQKVGADGFIYNTMRDGTIVNTGVQADRQMWFRDHPGMAPQLVGKDGSVQNVGGAPSASPGMLGSPGAPVPEGGSQAFVDDSLTLANQLIAAGIPEEQVDAFIRSRMNPQAAPQAAPSLARPSEAQTAAEVERAKQDVQMQYEPQKQAIQTQAAIERTRAEAVAKLEAEIQSTQTKKQLSAEDALGMLDTAEQLLQTATSGRAGASVDAALGFFGESTEGSRATASLKTLSGQLVAKMPRMEGPQSDRDVQMYKDMAGDLANPNLPRGDRLAALQTIRALNQKYAGQVGGGLPPMLDYGPGGGNVGQGGGQASPTRRKYNPATGRIE